VTQACDIEAFKEPERRPACRRLAIAVLLSLAACGGSGASGTQSKPTFAIVGDSQTNLIACSKLADGWCTSHYTDKPGPTLAAGMPGFELSVRARDGMRIDEMLPAAAVLTAAAPDVMQRTSARTT
jgi:hypothetical protein